MRVSAPFTLVARKVGNGIIFYYRYRREDGSRSSLLSTGVKCPDSSAKEKAKARRKANLVCLRLMQRGELCQSSSMTLRAYTKDFFTPSCRYVQWKLAKGSSGRKGLAPSTILFYRQKLNNLVLPYLGNIQMVNLNSAKIKNWILKLKEKYSNKSINEAIGVLRIVVKQAREDMLLLKDPMVNIGKLSVDKVSMELPTEEELRALFRVENWQNPILLSAAQLSCFTGMRIGEVLALQDTDVSGDYLDVRKSYEEPFGLGDIKNHLKRKVPACDLLLDVLPNRQGFLFEGEIEGQPYCSNAVREALRKAYRRAGIDYKKRNLTFHSFRHFFNTYLEKKDISPAKIRAVIGHKDSSMTGVYTNWNANEFPEVYEAQRQLIRSILWQ